MIGVRLCGGPFDGERAEQRWVFNTPATIYVVAHKGGPTEWLAFSKPVMGAEVYGRDEEDERGWLVYLFQDSRLGGGLEREERELVPAGGIPEDEQLDEESA